ncbi:MAG: nucleoside-diphosphate kinase [Patescibacteria group bacterium]|nr:nucleoside-diphosphate kinase [Patescibacteria group bacterium]MCL5432295.1 nucleoside-diphosphate kinase [Patescibacteria group bacterium]
MPKKSKFIEQTLVILKPDVVARGIMGEIITRFERKGLKIVAMKMVWPDEKLAGIHYDQPESAARLLGERTIASFRERGIEMKETPLQIAKRIQSWLKSYLSAGPVLVMVIEGAHAVAQVRKMRGHTNPLQAEVGTITADYTVDSYFLADEDRRSVRTLVHASGTVEEAEHEIKIWFKPEEIFDYKRAQDEILYSVDWEKKPGRGGGN